jgi:hypothetical protein
MYRYSCTRVRRGRRYPGLALATAACVPTRCTTGLAQAACEPIGWPVRGETPASSCVALTGAQTALHFVRWRTSARGRAGVAGAADRVRPMFTHAFPSSQTGEGRTSPTHHAPAGSGPFSPWKSSCGPPVWPVPAQRIAQWQMRGSRRCKGLPMPPERSHRLTQRVDAIPAGVVASGRLLS